MKYYFEWDSDNPENVAVNTEPSDLAVVSEEIEIDKRFVLFSWNDEDGYVINTTNTLEDLIMEFVDVVVNQWRVGEADDDWVIDYISDSYVDRDSGYALAILDTNKFETSNDSEVYYFSEGQIDS